MQTFLPYANLQQSFECLDYRRLGKQRVETRQILNILLDETTTKGWRNHPAVLMWEGFEDLLKNYFNDCVTEWVNRGYKNTMELISTSQINNVVKPWWFGDEKFHRAMRARLIEKNEEFYLPKFPNDKGFNESKYFWPENKTKTYRII